MIEILEDREGYCMVLGVRRDADEGILGIALMARTWTPLGAYSLCRATSVSRIEIGDRAFGINERDDEGLPDPQSPPATAAVGGYP